MDIKKEKMYLICPSRFPPLCVPMNAEQREGTSVRNLRRSPLKWCEGSMVAFSLAAGSGIQSGQRPGRVPSSWRIHHGAWRGWRSTRNLAVWTSGWKEVGVGGVTDYELPLEKWGLGGNEASFPVLLPSVLLKTEESPCEITSGTGWPQRLISCRLCLAQSCGHRPTRVLPVCPLSGTGCPWASPEGLTHWGAPLSPATACRKQPWLLAPQTPSCPCGSSMSHAHLSCRDVNMLLGLHHSGASLPEMSGVTSVTNPCPAKLLLERTFALISASCNLSSRRSLSFTEDYTKQLVCIQFYLPHGTRFL